MRKTDIFSKSRKQVLEFVAATSVVSILLLLRKNATLSQRLNELEQLHEAALSTNDTIVKTLLKTKPNTELEDLYNHYKNTGELNRLNIWTLNNTHRVKNTNLVIFNRVPKVGSTMFMKLMDMLATRNNFTVGFMTRENTAYYVSKDTQIKISVEANSLARPSALVQHIFYTNFTKFDLPNPIYINFVRDPVERIISWYYYNRTLWHYIETLRENPKLKLPQVSWALKDLESCVKSNDPECNYMQGDPAMKDFRRQLIYFCGHGPECRPFNTRVPFERAKLTVNREFSVVGVLEDLETSLAVFEQYIPRYFAGALQIYNDNKECFKKINSNSAKPPVSEEVKRILRQRFSYELEFYEFCKKRLFTQFIAANELKPK